MIWRRSIHTEKAQKFLYLFAVLILIVSIYGGSMVLFSIGAMLMIGLILSSTYLKKISQKLVFQNKKTVYRLFPGDEETWQLKLSNYSRLPVLQSTLEFSLNNQVALNELQPRDQLKGYNVYELPMVFQPKEHKTLTIPVKGLHRGVARFYKFEILLRDPMNFERYQLLNDRLVRTEFIIYPTPLSIKGIDKIIQLRQGERAVPLSLYEDPTMVIGTREYEPGDPFQNIHWKASARMDELQTKVYEKTLTQTWTILLNINVDPKLVSKYGETEIIEKQISHAAYLCQYATEHNIPFDLYVNIRTSGKVPYLHLEKGEGKQHLLRALELLARMSINSVRAPMHRLLSLYDSWKSNSTAVIVVGDLTEDGFYYDRWKARGMDVFYLSLDDATASLEVLESKRRASS